MEEEKKIPHYVNDPVINRLTAPEKRLIRPQIHWFRAFCAAMAAAAGTAGLSYLTALAFRKAGALGFENMSQRQAFFRILPILGALVFALSLRYILIWFVRIYQRYAKSETRLRCCYTPSCSEYAILALKKYGALVGGIKAVRRLLRCGPPGGIDYP